MPTIIPGTEFLDGQPIFTRNLETGDVLCFENGQWTNLNRAVLGTAADGQNATAIVGFPVSVLSLSAGDMLEYSGSQWVNKSKDNITDGGNF